MLILLWFLAFVLTCHNADAKFSVCNFVLWTQIKGHSRIINITKCCTKLEVVIHEGYNDQVSRIGVDKEILSWSNNDT